MHSQSIWKLLLTIDLVIVCHSSTKIWNSSLDLNSDDNWNLKRIPCAGDRLIFPEDLVIYLDQELNARQIVSTIVDISSGNLLAFVRFCLKMVELFSATKRQLIYSAAMTTAMDEV